MIPPVPLSADAVSIIGDRTRRLDAGHTVAVTKESSTRTLSADEERMWEELHALMGSLPPRIGDSSARRSRSSGADRPTDERARLSLGARPRSSRVHLSRSSSREPLVCRTTVSAGCPELGILDSALGLTRLLVPPLHRVASQVPRNHAALERHHAVAVIPGADQPPRRRTGAGVLVRSGAVQDDRLTLGDRL